MELPSRPQPQGERNETYFCARLVNAFTSLLEWKELPESDLTQG